MSAPASVVITRAVRTGVTRTRLARATRFFLYALMVTLGVQLVLALAWRLAGRAPLANATLAWTAIATFGAIAIASTLVAFLLRVDPMWVAHRIDSTFSLADRLRSAITFERKPPEARSAFEEAAVLDAARALTSVDPRGAFSLRPPRAPLAAIPILCAIVFVVAWMRLPPPRAKPRPPLPSEPKLIVPSDALSPQQRELEQRIAQLARDPDAPAEARAEVEALNQLLRDLADEKLTRKEAFDRLAALERRAQTQAGSRPEELERAWKRVGEAIQKDSPKAARDVGKALAEEDLDKAREALSALAKEAERLAKEKEAQRPQDERDREELARALDKSAAAAKREESEEQKRERQRDAEEQKLREEERRLKKQLEARPDDEDLKRRLQKNKRELERLERDKQQAQAQKRELQRLKRELERAAEELRKKLSPEALKQLQDQLREMQNEIKKLDSSQRTQDQIAEIKEVLRRMSQQKIGQGKSNERQSDFEKRASQGKALTLGGDGKGGSLILPIPMPGEGQGEKPGDQGDGPGKDKPGSPDGKPGSEHDPNLLGDPTRLKAQHKESRVAGQQGDGPTRSESILSAAQKGFAQRGYRKTFTDYTSILEEVMTQERVPAAERAFIKRYFELIKPRE